MGQIEEDFPVDLFAPLELILETLHSNTMHSPAINGNIFTLRSYDSYARVLEIAWDCGTDLQTEPDRLLYLPVTKDDGIHYGFFMVGVHARAAGGHAEIARGSQFSDDPQAGFTVRVYLPYQRIEKLEI